MIGTRGPGTRGLSVGMLTVLLFGTTVVLQGILVQDGIVPFVAVGIRYLGAGLVCLSVAVMRRQALLPVPGERVPALALGGLVYGLQAVLFYGALGHGSVASVSLLFYTYPVLVLVASLGLRLLPWSWLAAVSAALSAGGAAVVVGSGRHVAIDGPGVAMALGSASCVAVFLLGNSRLLPRTTALVAAAWVSFGVALVTLTVALSRGEWHVLSARAFLILGFAGAATGLGTAGMYVTLALLGPAPTSVLLSLQTLVAIVGSALVLSQPILARQAAGGLAIIAAIALAALGQRVSRRRPSAPPSAKVERARHN